MPISVLSERKLRKRGWSVHIPQSDSSLAEDSSATLGSGGDVRQERQVLTVNRGSGRQEVVVTRRMYPVYQGAVVVCQGADSAAVRLAVTQAVSDLTGLGADHISVVKMKSF